MPPLVTIIIPTYNCAQFIGETVKSVLVQVYRDIQYIVIDDCSTDATWQALVGIPDIAKVQFNRHTENKGEQATVNEGLKLVKGKYFMIVNADDPLLPGAVTTLTDFMESHPDVLCGYPDWDSINEDGSFRHHVQSREYDFCWMVRHHTCLPSVGSIFRKEVIDLIGYRDISLCWLGDFDYWLRIGLIGKMARVPKTLATWRQRDGQGSGIKSDERAAEHVRVIRKLYDNAETLLPPIGESFCWAYLVAVSVCKSRSKRIKYLWEAVKAYPKLLISLDFYIVVIRRALHYFRR